MAKQFWLVKQEPEDYAFSTFVQDGHTAWTGVRNYQARIHLRGMKRGDLAAYYHSGDSREIVGLARVVKEAYPDPTATEGEWVCVDLEPVRPLPRPVTLAAIKAEPALKNFTLVRNSRLSVMPVSPEDWERLMKMASAS